MVSRGRSVAVVAIVLLAGAAVQAADAHGEIGWLTNQGDAFEQAGERSTALLVDVWAVWCKPCKVMDKTTWSDATVIEEIGNFVALKVDADANEIFAETYRADILPTTLVLDVDGGEIARFTGLVGPDELVETLRTVRNGYPEYRDRISRRRDPIALRGAADYLLGVGNGTGAVDLLKRALKAMKSASPDEVEEVEIDLARAYLAGGEPAAAGKLAERLADKGSSDSVRGRALQILVAAERERGREDRANRALDRLRDEFPELAGSV